MNLQEFEDRANSLVTSRIQTGTWACIYNGRIMKFYNGRNLYKTELLARRVLKMHLRGLTDKIIDDAISKGVLVIKEV